jgi:phosphoribosyl 1,2-cyclic phosphate phosphodiesterase
LLNFLQQKKFVPFQIGQVTVTPVPLVHSKVNYGYCFEHGGSKLAYLTDTLGLPPATESFLKEWGDFVMVLDCSHPPQEKAKNHNDWMHAIRCVEAVTPNETWLTHIGHDLDQWLTYQINLPRNVKIARDMEIIDVLQVQHGDA